MRVLFFALSCAVLLHEATGIIFSKINLCKNPCKSTSDCKSNQRCVEFILCGKKKICQKLTGRTRECYNASDLGASYRGFVVQSETGKTCQSWSEQTPHRHSRTAKKYPESGLEKNYCRNPDREQKPWCYTTDKNARWEYCNIPECSDEPKPTTTTTTTTTGTPTTVLPPNTCPPPAKSDLIDSYRCSGGYKKNMSCLMKCKDGYCPKTTNMTVCKCKSGKCSWDKDLSDGCKAKNKDECKVSKDCGPGARCSARSCGKVCIKSKPLPPCRNKCITSAECPRESICTGTICKQCKRPEACLPTLSCKTSATCKHGMSCVKTTCGMQCKHQSPEIRRCTCPKTGCSWGQMCMTSWCGRECRPMLMPLPNFNKCRLPCSSSGKCRVGYKCEKQACGRGCVAEPAPSCPVGDPTSGTPLPSVVLCPKVLKTCLAGNPKACGENEVCCHSKVCRKNICQAKVNDCPATETAKCASGADCPSEEKCVHHKGGCKKCTKGFFCPRHKNRCNEDSDCKSPVEKCTVGDDACRTCSSNSFAGSVDKCLGKTACASDSECANGKKCMLMKSGCRTCQMPRLGGSCIGRCFSGHSCANGEACVEQNPGCKICRKKL